MNEYIIVCLKPVISNYEPLYIITKLYFRNTGFSIDNSQIDWNKCISQNVYNWTGIFSGLTNTAGLWLKRKDMANQQTYYDSMYAWSLRIYIGNTFFILLI